MIDIEDPDGLFPEWEHPDERFKPKIQHMKPACFYSNKQYIKNQNNTIQQMSKTLLSPERTYLAGVSYSDYQKVKQFKIGTELGLIWERNNPVDKQAIAVYYKGIRIGYIPAPKKDRYTGELIHGIQSRMHNLRSCGYKTKAILTQYRPTAAKAWEIFTIEVQFSDPDNVATTGNSVDVEF